MSILTNISRRLSMLTTDAKPDPPRTNITENTQNIPSTNEESTRKTPDGNFPRTDNFLDPLRRQSSRGSDSSCPEPGKNSGEKKNPRAKRKSSSNKNGHAANVVNYNIINSSGVKIGATTTYVCNVNQYDSGNLKDTRNQNNNPSPKTTPRPVPDSVEALSVSQKELSIEDMFCIKSHIGSDWRDIFKSLGYSEGQLDQFEENHKSKGIDEVIYQSLLDWKQANGREAHIGVIVKILWKYQQYDCAERLAAAQIIS